MSVVYSQVVYYNIHEVFRMFVDRKEELAILNDTLESGKAEFVIIYGRRRIGKTELLKQMLTGNDNAVYLLGRSEAPRDMLRRFSQLIADKLYDRRLARFPFRSLDEMFYYIDGRKNVILVLDEFPFMVSSEPGLLSIIQDYWDNHLKTTSTKLFVCGSSMGMVERLLFDYSSPIYGRRTKQLKIEPLNFQSLVQFFPKIDFDELHRIYSVLGGTPAYLLEYEKDILTTIRNRFLRKDQFLYKDAEFVLRAELREPRYYFSIIRSIASGNTSLGRIMNDTGLSKDVASKYVATLQDLDIIKRVWPVTEKPGTRKGIYEIRDNFFRFYFRFIYPNLEYVEMGEIDFLMEKIESEFPMYLGRTMEDLVIELVKQRHDILPFKPTKVGKWWHKEEEIDLVAIDERSDEILFCEVKTTRERIGVGVLRDLMRKAKMVRWGKKDKKRKEHYMLISKSGFSEKVDGAICIKAEELMEMNVFTDD